MGGNNSSGKKSHNHCESTNISRRPSDTIQSDYSKREDIVKKQIKHTCVSTRRKEAIEYFNSLNNLEEYFLEKSNFKARVNNETNIIKLSNTIINQLCQNYFDKELNSSLNLNTSNCLRNLLPYDSYFKYVSKFNNLRMIENSEISPCNTSNSLKNSFIVARTQNKNKLKLQQILSVSKQSTTKVFYSNDKNDENSSIYCKPIQR